jgi:hypothetical protein
MVVVSIMVVSMVVVSMGSVTLRVAFAKVPLLTATPTV